MTATRRLGTGGTALLLAAGIALAAVPGASLAAGTEFGAPTATAAWGQGVTFTEPVVLPSAPSRVEALIESGGSPGSFVTELPEARKAGSTTFAYTVDTASTGTLPNTRFTARWRVTYPDGTVEIGPPVTATYADTRFQWRTDAGPIVRVHWYAGSDAFAQQALRLAEDGIAKATALFGVSETAPVDFFVYATQSDLLGALGPGTREWVGGTLDPGSRTLFTDQTDASSSSDAIAHELTHLVFDTAVHNPYHSPARWFDEGLAVYLAQGYDAGYRTLVDGSVGSDALMPLTALGGEFPTNADRAGLAYGESVSAIEFLVRTYGRDALVRIVKAYAAGSSDDEAFRAGIGIDVAGFQDAWLKDLGAAEPRRYGPQSPPPGPLPAGWSGPAATADSGGAAASAVPAPTVAASVAGAAGEGSPTDDLVPGLAVAAVLAAGVAAFYLLGRRGRGAVTGPGGASSLAGGGPSPAPSPGGPDESASSEDEPEP